MNNPTKSPRGEIAALKELVRKLDNLDVLVERLLSLKAKWQAKARIDEARHYCDDGHYHDNARNIAMLPSERLAELQPPKDKDTP